MVTEEHTSNDIVDAFQCGYIALIGEPNVGKSTIMNSILGTKLSIVSRKPQTTRRRILGFHSGIAHQIIFIDTPGIIEPSYLLQRAMVQSAINAITECDVVLLIIDGARAIDKKRIISEQARDHLRVLEKPIVIGLNKIDIIQDKGMLLPLMEEVKESFETEAIIPISAKNGDGMELLLKELVRLLPRQKPLYPPDLLSDQPIRFFVSEIIREKIFEQFREEVPYSTEVEIREYVERESAKDFIAAEVVVERETQKAILIGKNGGALKRVSKRARLDIEAFLGKGVFLEIFVKVREGWRDSAGRLREMGYRVG